MLFKKATMQDLDMLVQIRMEVLRGVFGLSEDQDMSDLEQENLEYYQRALANKEHIACLVFADGLFVGCGGLCLQKELPSPDNLTGKCGYLMNIYVREAHRNKGIGKQIVAWLIEQAKIQKISKLTLETSPEGICLYQSMGFDFLKNYMHLPMSS